MNQAALAVRGVLSRPLRFVATALAAGVIIAILLTFFAVYRTFVNDSAAMDLVLTSHARSFTVPLDHKHLDKIRALPGVEAATPWHWFSGTWISKPDANIGAIAVEPEAFLRTDHSISVEPALAEAWSAQPDGALVDEDLAKEHGLKVGDRIAFDSAFTPAPSDEGWLFTVRGVYKKLTPDAMRNGVYVNWKYVNTQLPPDLQDRISFVYSRPAGGSGAQELARQIDEVFAGSGAPTFSQDRGAAAKSFRESMLLVFMVVRVVAVVFALMAVLIVLNTVQISIRQRRRQLAMLRAIGFSRLWVASVLTLETALLGLSAGLFGVGVSVLLGNAVIGPALRSFGDYDLGAERALGALGIAVGLGILAGVGPALMATRGKINDQIRAFG